jgi:hypothetical protein
MGVTADKFTVQMNFVVVVGRVGRYNLYLTRKEIEEPGRDLCNRWRLKCIRIGRMLNERGTPWKTV